MVSRYSKAVYGQLCGKKPLPEDSGSHRRSLGSGFRLRDCTLPQPHCQVVSSVKIVPL